MLVDDSKVEEAVKVALKNLAELYDSNSCSADIATVVHRAVYDTLGTDPYKEMKISCNNVALQLLPRAEKYITDSDDSLRAAVTCAIVGNVFDFGIAGSIQDPGDLGKQFDVLYNEGVQVDDTDKIRTYLKPGAKLLFFTDNCGEVVFDKLLLRELGKFEVKLTVVVKGEPILTDATMEDAENLGLKDVSDEVMDTNAFAVGMDLDKATPELMNKMRDADLIISKGMANFEIFSETDYKPIAYLMRTKCQPVAEALGMGTDLNIARLIE
jgi:uncharacterized protein with ATP-grasp and redox domains